MPNVSAFGQQSSLGQLGQLPTQIPIANQIPVNQNQIIANPNTIGAVAANPLSLHIGQMNRLNGVPNTAITMSPQMMMQLGRSNIANDGWSGMLTQNIQPASGSNPFFNLTAQQQQTTAFASQLPQQMSQMSLGDMNFASTTDKPAAATLPG